MLVVCKEEHEAVVFALMHLWARHHNNASLVQHFYGTRRVYVRPRTGLSRPFIRNVLPSTSVI